MRRGTVERVPEEPTVIARERRHSLQAQDLNMENWKSPTSSEISSSPSAREEREMAKIRAQHLEDEKRAQLLPLDVRISGRFT